MATACFFGLVAFFFNAARASYFAPRWRPQEQPTCPVPLRVLASFSMLFPTPYSNRAGYKQSTSRTKDDQCYDSFSRRKFSTNVDRMLGVLADKMVERGEIHVICLAYNAKSITIWCLEDAIW
jgi:hypothetical protein